jgi:disulfide bond formation protein DsbB
MSIRLTYLLGFLVVCAILLTSIYFQVFEGIMPCPLCTLQRISFGILGLLFLTGLIAYKKVGFRLFINTLCGLTSMLGIFLASRQVWLQHFPSADASECGVSLQYMMQVLPMNEVIQKIFTGSAECTQRGWEFLQMNMAEWALICFIGFTILSIWLLCKECCGNRRLG